MAKNCQQNPRTFGDSKYFRNPRKMINDYRFADQKFWTQNYTPKPGIDPGSIGKVKFRLLGYFFQSYVFRRSNGGSTPKTIHKILGVQENYLPFFKSIGQKLRNKHTNIKVHFQITRGASKCSAIIKRSYPRLKMTN